MKRGTLVRSYKEPSASTLLDNMLDITMPMHSVEVQISGDRLWVNVDGICLLRICQIPDISVEFMGKTLTWKERQK